VKPYTNSVEVHPQVSKINRHPVDGALVGVGLVDCGQKNQKKKRNYFTIG
jgi:hypothetical protein